MSCSYSKAFTLGTQNQMQLLYFFKAQKNLGSCSPAYSGWAIISWVSMETDTERYEQTQWGSLFRGGEAVDFISHWNLLGINELKIPEEQLVLQALLSSNRKNISY